MRIGTRTKLGVAIGLAIATTGCGSQGGLGVIAIVAGAVVVASAGSSSSFGGLDEVPGLAVMGGGGLFVLTAIPLVLGASDPATARVDPLRFSLHPR